MLFVLETFLILVGLAVLVVLFLAIRRPDHFAVTRSILIAAPPARIFPLVNRFDRWARWSPWEKLDPSMKRSFAGPKQGTGSIYEWRGNSKAGAGRMEILGSTRAEAIEIGLSFLAPVKAENRIVFTFRPEGEGTEVIWTMTGRMKLLNKIFDLIVNMERFVGADFEKGLQALKAEAEKT